ncbi:hypothetical protein GCM10022297_08020 [Lactobacillus hamsteri]|uniref:Gram-positive cocci surface proteins LPxTG domain-containing protein n=1 Tax=Lactobacillus hamsteri DSM 5661 = JCM 6256 TaxID=1423754 RepID=A0A0R1YDH6_9LACO|nr:LPXTG cell wall anchor domain-containing protein [Lactobacillus hamsteri]KRM40510.1 hypothetical protein FC39_GL000533 [Lactobacillus hamsteri DSM 5661 = JCM 6256]
MNSNEDTTNQSITDLNSALAKRNDQQKEAAQNSNVTVTKTKSHEITGTDANNAEQKAAEDYQKQAGNLIKAIDDQQKAQTQSDKAYENAVKAYNDALIKYRKTLHDAQSVQFGKNGPILDDRHKSKPLTVAVVDPKDPKNINKETGIVEIKPGEGDEVPVGDVIKTGNDLNQALSISSDDNATVTVDIDSKYQATLTYETGNDNDYKDQGVSTFAPQGAYHSIVFKSAETGKNTSEIADHFADVTFDNLHGSSYQGTPITKVVMSLSNLERKGTAQLNPNKGVSPEHYGKHAVVVYDDITRGFQFSGVSVDVTYTFYDSQGNQINFDSNKDDAWFTPFSLNNHGNYIEAVHSLDSKNIQPARLMGSSVKPHLKGDFNADADGEYADSVNDGVKITFNYSSEVLNDPKLNKNLTDDLFKEWDNSESDDPDGLRTFGAGLYHVKGNQIKLRFFIINKNQDFNYKTVKSGSMAGQPQWTYGSTWTGITTNIPHYSQAPAKPVKKGESTSATYYDNNLQVPGSVTYVVEDGAKGKNLSGLVDQTVNVDGQDHDLGYAQKDPYSFTNNINKETGTYGTWEKQDVVLPHINEGYAFYEQNKDGTYKYLASAKDKNLKQYLDAHDPNKVIYIKANRAYNIHYIDVNGIDKSSDFTTRGKDLIEHEVKNINSYIGDTKDATNRLLWNYADEGYVLVSNPSGDKLGKQKITSDMGTADDTLGDQYVYLKHGVVPVTPDKPEYPGNVKKEDQKATQVSHSRTIHYLDDETGTAISGVDAKKQTITWGRTAVYDKVDGKFLGYLGQDGKIDPKLTDDNSWAVISGAYDAVDSPDLTKLGYKAAPSLVQHQDDQSGKTVGSASGDPSKDAADVNVYYFHDMVTITPENPGHPREPINPNDPRPKDEQPKYPDGTDKDSLQHDVKRTIKYIYSDGSPASESVHDVLHFKETKVIDKVTGEVISDTWEGPKDFITKFSPHISGYTPDRLQVSNKNIGHDHDDIVETVIYTPDSVPPADPEDQGSTPTSDPIPDNPTDPKKPTQNVPNVPDGYEPDNGEDEGDIEIKIDKKKVGKTTKTEKNNRGGEVDKGISIDRHTSKKINEVKTDGVSTKIERVKNDVKTLPQTGEKKNIAGLVGLALLATAGLLILGGDKRKNK